MKKFEVDILLEKMVTPLLPLVIALYIRREGEENRGLLDSECEGRWDGGRANSA